jgi:hypothetical protein
MIGDGTLLVVTGGGDDDGGLKICWERSGEDGDLLGETVGAVPMSLLLLLLLLLLMLLLTILLLLLSVEGGRLCSLSMFSWGDSTVSSRKMIVYIHGIVNSKGPEIISVPCNLRPM